MTEVSGQGATSERVLIRTLRDRVGLLHILVLPLSLGMGRLLCGTDLGWSDSLVLARPVHSSAAEYVSHWYTHLNGRLSQAVVASLAQPLSSFSPTPESFPFWLFTGLSLSCILLTALLIGSSVSRASGAATPGLVVAIVILAVWGVNGALFENITYRHFAIFIDYPLPTYLTAFWFRRTLDLAFDNPSRLRFLLHATAYLIGCRSTRPSESRSTMRSFDPPCCSRNGSCHGWGSESCLSKLASSSPHGSNE